MTLETYLAIALLQMGHDAMQTYNAKMHYRVVSSLMLALMWPITNALMVAGVVIRQRHNNPITINRKGLCDERERKG